MSPSRINWPFEKAARADDPCSAKSLTEVVNHNIKVIEDHRRESEQQKTLQDHVADLITRWSGSMLFIYLHVAWFGFWIAANLGLMGIKPFDPFPYGLLTTIVSLEAIFLSTFVLVSQNRQGALADRRAELDLQINLLSEYEMTRVLTLVDAIARKLEVADCDNSELAELKQDVKPEELLGELEKRAEKMPGGKNKS